MATAEESPAHSDIQPLVFAGHVLCTFARYRGKTCGEIVVYPAGERSPVQSCTICDRLHSRTLRCYDGPVRPGPPSLPDGLSDDIVEYAAVDVSQPELAPLEGEGQFLVVQT